MSPLLKPTARELLAGIKIIDVDTHISESPTLWTEARQRASRTACRAFVGEGERSKMG